MKEVKKFVCEVCGSEYNEKENAQKCERDHKIPMDIIMASYLPVAYDSSGYPSRLTVKMSDDSECVYIREGI